MISMLIILSILSDNLKKLKIFIFYLCYILTYYKIRKDLNMKKGMIVILSLFFLIISSNYSSSTEKFDSLMALGKNFYKEYDTLQSDYIFKVIKLKKAKQYFKEALEIKPNDSEANYFMGYSYDSEIFGSSPGDSIPLITFEKAKEISEYFVKSIKASKRYEGEKLILSPYSKITSLYGCSALAFLSKGNIDSAIVALKEGKANFGFNDAILEYTRNLLSNCDTNSILFTWGDMDTFPLYYLQLVENYRKDVLIANIGLLNTKWYSKLCLLDSTFNRAQTNFQLNSLDSLMEVSPVQVELKSYTIEVPFDVIKRYKVKDNVVTSTGVFQWIIFGQKFHEANFLTYSDLVLLEIFKTNKWQRKLAFATTCNTNIFYCFGWLKNIIQKGLIYELTPDTYKVEEQVDYQYLKSMLLDSKNGWKMKEIFNSIVLNDEDTRLIVSNYQQTFLLYAYYCTEILKNVEKTKEILQKFELALPMTIIDIDKRDLNYWADIYRFSGQIDKANYIQSLIYDK
jgi:hypothetical protein